MHRLGGWLRRNQRLVRRLQWAVVATYLVLVSVPALLPLPGRTAHMWNDLTLFAQFVFWGIWWPFVLLSMVVVGRAWCGLFCPEGALSEFASARGRGRRVPRWITWPGWPFAAFALTTIYGQMVSVYQYPKPTLLILGGSTLAAVAVGRLYGRNKRVWCRYLCPVNGVFALLARLAPVHFRVNRAAWDAWPHRAGGAPQAVNCAPLVPIRTMQGASLCHMCGRCDGFRGAVALSPRSPNAETLAAPAGRSDAWETALILFGLMGLAPGAFHWADSAWFIAVKQALAEWLVDRGILWPLEVAPPWWILTHYPERNDVMTLLDGAVLITYVLAATLVMGLGLSALCALGTRALGRWSWPRFHHLARSLVPLAGCGVFLGLSALTVTMLREEGLRLREVNDLRAALLAAATLWSVWLAWRIAGLGAGGWRRAAATAAMALACLAADAGWISLFWR
ncbi:MAG: 4Fe-4S binding protein [Rhodospirillaceae bacterium]|nr:4Fe-4S binding protein [Rhodospirillaceae bacterium]